VTEPKRSQKSKRPLSSKPTAHRYSIYGNALELIKMNLALALLAYLACFAVQIIYSEAGS